MRPLAFLTDRLRPTGTPDDRLAVAPLAALGLDVRFVPWEEAAPGSHWAGWVIRSPWNYYRAPSAFLGALDPLSPLLNPLAAVRWNSDKRYLIELAEAGAPIIPSVVAPVDALADVAESTGWERLVVKPCVSAAGEGVRRLHADALGEAETFAGLPDGDYLVQPFLDDVVDAGEVSAIYFGGEFSHALRKRPAPGGFLVHEEHGGSVEPTDIGSALVAEGEAVLRACPAGCAYARVDWIETARGPRLVEVELIEPELFLRIHPEAPARFAAAIDDHLRARSGAR